MNLSNIWINNYLMTIKMMTYRCVSMKDCNYGDDK